MSEFKLKIGDRVRFKEGSRHGKAKAGWLGVVVASVQARSAYSVRPDNDPDNRHYGNDNDFELVVDPELEHLRSEWTKLKADKSLTNDQVIDQFNAIINPKPKTAEEIATDVYMTYLASSDSLAFGEVMRELVIPALRKAGKLVDES